MTDLATLVEPLKREVAVPGTFATAYASTQDDDLKNSLMDAFANANLDGFLLDYQLDLSTAIVTPDLPPAGRAILVTYAAERILFAKIAGLKNRALYEAGPVKYETEQSASVLTQLLKMIQERRRELLSKLSVTGTVTRDMFLDRYLGSEVNL